MRWLNKREAERRAVSAPVRDLQLLFCPTNFRREDKIVAQRLKNGPVRLSRPGARMMQFVAAYESAIDP
jgi:hypothetical protein